MKRIIFKILLITIMMFFSLLTAQAGSVENIQIDPSNILTEDQIDMALNNDPVNCTVVKQNDRLYIDSTFFTNYLKIPSDQISNYTNCEGTVKIGNKDILCVPLFSVLDSLGIRYTYNPIFNKDIVRIRTDKDFSVNTSYVYTPSGNSSQGNTPVASPITNIDYTVSTYSDLDYGYPYTYNTYYPPGYIPGYYIGSYGHVGGGPVINRGGGSIHGGGHR